jgi:acyl carrier protein
MRRVGMANDNAAGLETRDIETRIFEFMQRELLSPEMRVERDDELLSGEMLDSIGVLRLATFVQEEFRFKMQPAEFVIENFQSVAALAEYVCRAAGQTPVGPTR